jgi:hypothetical protein
VSNGNNKLDSKSKQLIVGIFAVLILLTFSAVMLIAAYNFGVSDSDGDSTTIGVGDIYPVTTDETENASNYNQSAELTNSSDVVNNQDNNGQVEISVEGLEEFTKTGDNMISDSPDNEFIKLIVQARGVDAGNLVAIYAAPDLGNNFVLEVVDKRDDHGNIIRSPKTLKKIYHINKERNITVATGKPTGNEGVDYGTSLMTYYLVTDVVMPEFPDYFTDVG